MVTAKLAQPLIQLSHLFTGEEGWGGGGEEEEGESGERKRERERLDSYFISPHGFNDFVGAVKAERIVSCIKDDNLKEVEKKDTCARAHSGSFAGVRQIIGTKKCLYQNAFHTPF